MGIPEGIISIIFGIIIIIWPRIIAYLLGFYLIIIGIITLLLRR